LDLIIDALELVSHVQRGVVYPAGHHMQIAQALFAARELKALKPVAWAAIDKETNNWFVTTCFDAQECEIPLYDLGEVTR